MIFAIADLRHDVVRTYVRSVLIEYTYTYIRIRISCSIGGTFFA